MWLRGPVVPRFSVSRGDTGALTIVRWHSRALLSIYHKWSLVSMWVFEEVSQYIFANVFRTFQKLTEGRWSGRESLTGRLLRAGNVGSDLGLRGSQPHTPSIAPGTTSSEATAAECRGWLRNVLLRHCCPPQPCTRDRDSWGGDLNSTS